jgi:hypothetical protein
MTNRLRSVAIFGLVLIIFLILAAGLGTLELKPGELFSIPKVAELPLGSPVHSGQNFWPVIIQAIMVLFAVLLPFSIIYMLIDPQRRKRFFSNMILLGFILLALYFVRQALINQAKNNEAPITPPAAIPPADLTPIGTPMVFVPNPADTMVTITALILGVLGVAGGFLAWWLIARNNRRKLDPMELLAVQAEVTIEELLAGKNLRETILICYRKMTEIVAANRNLPRESSVTPQEFKQSLISKGLPASPVHDLTQIFEDVRYGDLNAGEEERRRAVSALRIIAAVCRTPENNP